MKLFVWNAPYSIDYGGSVLFAVAETVEQARKIAKTADCYSYGKYRNDKAETTTDHLGEPTRVHDLPCAEWYEWSE